ncbi:short-chain dehydrogenase/reductase SDR [Celeribacter baekdonensis B30]|uniref:Short-chain dehydrogenase/reductase SDR n=1 Tax=Celeribacter baekdonensis B30 TaxID=1208323 RepID=K2J6A5_9RHOB|nr:short-chain dehydrogenase/reductase SDR [Celeribacter baekdonensis B30]
MRRPSVDELPGSDRPKVLPLDVTDPGSIALALSHAGQIDALVNTAGLGMLNVLEGADIAQVREEGLAPS